MTNALPPGNSSGTPSPLILLLISMQQPFIADLQQHYSLKMTLPAELSHLPASELPQIQAVVTNGSTGLTAEQMEILPGLKLVCSYGAGYENIDVAAATQRGIAVTHAPGVNNASVADHALALTLAISRGLPQLDRALKAGGWLQNRQPRPTVNGKRLGLLGMGNIGELIAKRAAGFDMQIAYHTRRPRPELVYRYVPSVNELAADSDYLILACPGGAATRHLINHEALEHLGPQGFLVNVARGSVVDTCALMEALRAKRIAGAALDVIEDEPELPPGVEQLDNLILTPHVSGRSPEAQLAQHTALLKNLAACFAGQPLHDQLLPALKA
ncbi:2-hydroxyacid dehydrogenase [Undibacterium terreum]|uniref:2-hydroxyacid dehydrogenase n=1 Tax=Undibacterium terreum TaxID=1224302 RepID=A0A916XLV7_9BURK|nr:2-hydroxyacid dehydrogenase [Undibacterium terreum]GGC85255.1 2-hydroxyacid dehydrogenase [Undibacterium terreum]